MCSRKDILEHNVDQCGVGICFFTNSQVWVFENKKFKELSLGSFIFRRFKELPRFGF